MDKKTSEDAASALAKLKHFLEDDEVVVFTPDQARALIELATVWGQIKAVVSLSSAIGGGLKWLIVFAATWAAFKGGVLDWIRTGIESK